MSAAAAHSAAVITIVVAKEIADPLILKIVATGSPGGGNGSGGPSGSGSGNAQVEPLPGQSLEGSFEQQKNVLDGSTTWDVSDSMYPGGCLRRALDDALPLRGYRRALIEIFDESGITAHVVLGIMGDDGAITVLDHGPLGIPGESAASLDTYLAWLNRSKPFAGQSYSRLAILDVSPLVK